MNNLSIFSVNGSMTPIVILLVLSDLILRGVALFKSAQKGQKVWFVFLLIVNSLGILPIVYLLINKDIRLTKTVMAPNKTVVKGLKKKRNK